MPDGPREWTAVQGPGGKRHANLLRTCPAAGDAEAPRAGAASVLEEAARRMAMRPTLGKEREGWAARDFSVAEIFTNFNAIQVTLGVVMRAIIDGRIDNKAAGRLLWELQIAAKLLRLQERTAMVATRRNRCGLEELALQNVGEPARAAEQILQPHAKDLEDRRCHASSASGWHLDVEAVMPKQNLIGIERAA